MKSQLFVWSCEVTYTPQREPIRRLVLLSATAIMLLRRPTDDGHVSLSPLEHQNGMRLVKIILLQQYTRM